MAVIGAALFPQFGVAALPSQAEPVSQLVFESEDQRPDIGVNSRFIFVVYVRILIEAIADALVVAERLQPR